MFADVVGYSRMMASNEERTLELLKDFENICSPIISKHEGEIIKKVGDELFCEFSSAKQAVDSALAIQESIHPYNDSRPKDFKLQVRIGIHVGDIVIRDEDVFGDGVNVASRIQPFASPGGICVSNAVRDALSSHPNYDIQSEGKQELKNIIEKYTLYSVKTGFEDKTIIKKYKKSKKTVPVLLCIVAVCIAGILFFGDSMNIWNLEVNKMFPTSEKVLIHITSLPGDIDKYMGEDHYKDIKGRKLIPLSINKLDSVRKNIESNILGEFIDTEYEMEIKNSSEDVTFLNKYSVLSFDDLSFSNVSINYKRFKCNRLHYINVYQFEKELDSSRPKYYFSEMRWNKLPSSGWNGSFAQSDFTNIEDQIFGFMREMYSGSGQVGTVLSIEDEIVYIKLNNLKIKENMNLAGESLYDFSKDGRKDRIDDLSNGITYLSNYNDTTSQLQIKSYSDEILSIQNGTGFNWFFDKEGNKNLRSFTTGFIYKLKVVDLQSDSIAVTKITELSYPYVEIRAGDQIRVD